MELFRAFAAEEAGRALGGDAQRRRLVVDPTALRQALSVSGAGFKVGAPAAAHMQPSHQECLCMPREEQDCLPHKGLGLNLCACLLPSV